MQKKYYFLVLILSLFAIIAYNEKPTNEELATYFTENKDTFLNLSKTTCLAQQKHKIVFHRFFHDSEGRTTEEELKAYPELDNELKNTINGEFLRDIIISGEPCRLSMSVWDTLMIGSGQMIGYEFNPKRISPYHKDIDVEKMIEEFKPIYYTIALSDGWYIFYEYTP